MSRKRSPILAVVFLPMIAALLLGVLLVSVFLISLPDRLESTFGPASPNLSQSSRYRLGIQLLIQEKDLTTPVDSGGAIVNFEVKNGESVPSILQNLVREGLISNPGAFRSYLQYTGLDTSLQAGSYRLSPAMTSIEIAHQMQDATPTEVVFTVLAGWRVDEIASSLPTSGLSISPEAFISTARMGLPDLPIPIESTLEGFLFPGEYTVDRNINAPTLISMMVTRFDESLNSEMREGFENQGLSLHEGVTLASIVEREAIIDDEMPIIASVFYNRLRNDIKLETDPSVQYALGYNEKQQTWWTNPLNLDDLKIESLYNTYLYTGLPPSPIANPGIKALRAAAFPAQTPYFYFRATCDGSGRHQFAETFQEHLENACP